MEPLGVIEQLSEG